MCSIKPQSAPAVNWSPPTKKNPVISIFLRVDQIQFSIEEAMGLASSSEAAVATRKAAKEANYLLDKQLKRDNDDCQPYHITYFSVKESEETISKFLNYLVRYHHPVLFRGYETSTSPETLQSYL